MDQQRRIQIQSTVLSMIDAFMVQNQVEAFEMEDALNKVMIQLKERISQDLLIELEKQKMSEQKSDEKETEEVDG